jgi:Ras-related protein Rab-5C
MSSQRSKQAPLPKLVLLGDSGVGKSALVQVVTARRQIRGGSIKISVRPTIAPDRAVVDLSLTDGTRTKVQLWDRPGRHVQPAMLRRFYDGCDGALLVYDVSSATSFEKARAWLDELRELAPPTCAVVLVGNKGDLAEAVAPRAAAELASDLGLVASLTASALDGSGVVAAFAALIETVLGVDRQSRGQGRSRRPQWHQPLPPCHP